MATSTEQSRKIADLKPPASIERLLLFLEEITRPGTQFQAEASPSFSTPGLRALEFSNTLNRGLFRSDQTGDEVRRAMGMYSLRIEEIREFTLWLRRYWLLSAETVEEEAPRTVIFEARTHTQEVVFREPVRVVVEATPSEVKPEDSSEAERAEAQTTSEPKRRPRATTATRQPEPPIEAKEVIRSANRTVWTSNLAAAAYLGGVSVGMQSSPMSMISDFGPPFEPTMDAPGMPRWQEAAADPEKGPELLKQKVRSFSFWSEARSRDLRTTQVKEVVQDPAAQRLMQPKWHQFAAAGMSPIGMMQHLLPKGDPVGVAPRTVIDVAGPMDLHRPAQPAPVEPPQPTHDWVQALGPSGGMVTLVAPPVTVASPEAETGGTAVSFPWATLARGMGPLDAGGFARLKEVLPEGSRLIYPALPTPGAQGVNLPLAPGMVHQLASRGYGMPLAPFQSDRLATMGVSNSAFSSIAEALPGAVLPFRRPTGAVTSVLGETDGEGLKQAGAGQAARGGALDFLGVPVRLAPSLSGKPELKQEQVAQQVLSDVGGSPAVRPQQFGLMRQQLFPNFQSVTAEPDPVQWKKAAPSFGMRSDKPESILATDARVKVPTPSEAKPQLDLTTPMAAARLAPPMGQPPIGSQNFLAPQHLLAPQPSPPGATPVGSPAPGSKPAGDLQLPVHAPQTLGNPLGIGTPLGISRPALAAALAPTPEVATMAPAAPNRVPLPTPQGSPIGFPIGQPRPSPGPAQSPGIGSSPSGISIPETSSPAMPHAATPRLGFPSPLSLASGAPPTGQSGHSPAVLSVPRPSLPISLPTSGFANRPPQLSFGPGSLPTSDAIPPTDSVPGMGPLNFGQHRPQIGLPGIGRGTPSSGAFGLLPESVPAFSESGDLASAPDIRRPARRSRPAPHLGQEALKFSPEMLGLSPLNLRLGAPEPKVSASALPEPPELEKPLVALRGPKLPAPQSGAIMSPDPISAAMLMVPRVPPMLLATPPPSQRSMRGPAVSIQRAVTGESPSSGGSSGSQVVVDRGLPASGDDANIQELAGEVWSILKRRIAVESQRMGR